MKEVSCLDIEIALIQHFNPRANLIVPNISWGMFLHECDVLVVSKAGVATEIEIKTDKYDLIKDKHKRHGHNSSKIQWLYFAVPTNLMPFIEHIPERAGIIEAKKDELGCVNLVFHRNAKRNGKYKFDDREQFKVARLGAMRIGGLKKTINTWIRNSKNTHPQPIEHEE